MNMKTLAPLGAAVVLGLVAMIVAKKSMTVSEPTAKAASTTTIVTLKRDIAAGQELAIEDVTAADLDSPVAPPGTFTTTQDVVGRVAIAPMAVGQPVLSPLLAPRGSVGGLQALVPTGMRAITIDVSETTSVGGMIVPGCLVDVLITLNGDAGGPLTKTLVQGVKIQAVGQRMGPAAKDAPAAPFASATLLVTPAQAETIELACFSGRPRLVLRSNSDTADSNTTGITLTELRGARDSNSEDLVVTQQVMERSPVAMPTETPATRPTSLDAGTTLTAVDEESPIARPIRRSSAQRRTVKVIKGGVESTVTFESSRSYGSVVDLPMQDAFGN
jgi:pilus assembly protein CpaB